MCCCLPFDQIGTSHYHRSQFPPKLHGGERPYSTPSVDSDTSSFFPLPAILSLFYDMAPTDPFENFSSLFNDDLWKVKLHDFTNIIQIYLECTENQTRYGL